MSERAMRTLRGMLAAAVATATALIGHVLGGGQLPGLLGVLLPLVAATLLSIGLVGRTLAFWRVGLAVIASQLAFHVLFVLGSTGTATQLGEGSMPGMVHEMSAGSLMVSANPLAAPAMTLGHIAAAVFTTVLLWRAEATLRSLAGLAYRVLARIRTLLPALVAAPLLPLPIVSKLTTPISRILDGSRSWRGPPAVI